MAYLVNGLGKKHEDLLTTAIKGGLKIADNLTGGGKVPTVNVSAPSQAEAPKDNTLLYAGGAVLALGAAWLLLKK